MKNKQLENKQNENKDTLLKRAGRIVAPLLVAGIMAMPGNADAGRTKETGAPLPGANIVSGKITGCKKSGLVGEGILVAQKTNAR